jgi:hypothetical protein
VHPYHRRRLSLVSDYRCGNGDRKVEEWPTVNNPRGTVTIEPFTSAEDTATFLCISRRHLLVMARRGMPGAYDIGTGTTRGLWVFRLSEVSQAITGGGRMAAAVPAE